MKILEKLITALRGGATEVGESIIDSNALRILDQEVRDASEALRESKNSLAEIMARQKLAEEKRKNLQAKIAEHEGYAVKALEKGDEALATEVAEKIAEFENQAAVEDEAAQGYAKHAAQMRAAIQQTERDLKRMKQQVDTVKATDSVQRAQSAVAERHSGSDSKMRTALDSLERIKEQQALAGAKMAAANELAKETSEDSLQEKLQAAGIAPNAHRTDDILARLRKQSGSKKS